MTRPGIGVIGVGRMGRTHAEAVRSLADQAQLVAVADMNEAAAKQVAELLGVPKYYSEPEEMLADPHVQGVIIATPSTTHAEWVKKAAAAGKHILCEKPLALTEADTLAAMQAARRHGVILQVGFMRRFLPEIRAARAAVRAGQIGTPVLYKALQRDESSPPAAFCDPAVSGGILLDMGIHEFDTGRWLLEQEVTEVYAVAGPVVEAALKDVGDVDNVVVQLRFDGGAVGQVDLSRNARYGDDLRFEVLGSDGAVFWGDLPRQNVVVGSASGFQQLNVPSSTPWLLPAWKLQAASFAQCIAHDQEPEVTGLDALAAFRIAQAAQASLEAGRPLPVTNSMDQPDQHGGSVKETSVR